MSKQTFDFSEALKRMKQGKIIKRKDWTTLMVAIYPKGRLITIDGDKGRFESVFTSDDILASDWEEVEG